MTVQLSVRGNLGKDFDLRAVTNPNNNEPNMVLNFSVASPTFKRNSEGKLEVVSTEWINCEYWNRDASHLHKILKTGMPVCLEGEERFEIYTNRDNVEVRARSLRVKNLFIVPNERIEGIALRPARDPAPVSANASSPDQPDDDIPM
ncbi:single-stranded DNA-binding protein [Neisseria weixii]|uniref:single-stranded DNA-binding protein n=1 Tax=Neisseria weixii TaxID=1853276 RepID=UPI000BB8887E|nr:single-stranded DNA-binding protein [Neisseria weixii]ATD64983.1 hypothetical protein CGZ65_05935 [Neisseria weixii]